MKRFFREVLGRLTGASLGLSLLIATLWIRSYWASDSVKWRNENIARDLNNFIAVECSYGGIRVTRDHADATTFLRLTPPSNHFQYTNKRADSYPYAIAFAIHWLPPFTEFRLLGFQWIRFDETTQNSHAVRATQSVTFPLATIFLLTLSVPALRIKQLRNQDQRQCRLLCGTCGYDLRATPTCCPECGTVPPRLQTIST
jgi:hypothetical protein